MISQTIQFLDPNGSAFKITMENTWHVFVWSPKSSVIYLYIILLVRSLSLTFQVSCILGVQVTNLFFFPTIQSISHFLAFYT